jgi:hypothetical protein
VQVTGFKIFNYYRNGDDTGVDEYDIIDIWPYLTYFILSFVNMYLSLASIDLP